MLCLHGTVLLVTIEQFGTESGGRSGAGRWTAEGGCPHMGREGYNLARRCKRSRLVATDFSKECITAPRIGSSGLGSRFLWENVPCFLMSYKDDSGSPVCLAILGIGVPRNASVSARSICFPYSVSSTAFHLRISSP